MGKIQVHELAKELAVESKELLSFLQKKGIDVKSPRKGLDDETIEMVRKTFGNKDKKENNDKKTNDIVDTKKTKKIIVNNRDEDSQRKKRKPVVVFRPQNTKDGERGALRGGKNQIMRKGSGFRPTDSNGKHISFSERASMREEAKRRAAEQKKIQEPIAKKEKKSAHLTGKKLSDIAKKPKEEKIENTATSIKSNDKTRKKDSRKKKEEQNQSNNQPHNKRRGRKDKPIYEENERQYKHPKKNVNQQKPKEEKEEEPIKLITIGETLTIQDLADKMKIKPSTIVKNLFMKGEIVTINQEITYENAEEIALDFDVLVEKEKVVDLVEEMLREDEEDEALMEKRPPVVCVMGHVDHGKTSLLDAIRNTNVIEKEAGGITQHIGAYTVEYNGEPITFLDTPGHEAFTSMRLRGAQSTDIAILVVAADDGVMPQTVEAINHAKAANTEIIVAVNKIDKVGANIERVKQELAEHGILSEDWGGTVAFCPVSAKTGEGISDLLEMLLLTAEVLELKANPNRKARGVVIESKLDKGKGTVATLLVQKGTLHVGEPITCGPACGKVRAMLNDKGKQVKIAGPSQPVKVLGLNNVPSAGEIFVACESEKEARSYTETFISQEKLHKLSENKSRIKMSLDDLYTQIKEGNLKELSIVVKADVQGSVEAVKQSLEKLSNEEVVVKVIHGAVGNISESDVTLAAASGAIIIGFNVKPDAVASDLAENEEVDMRLYSVIYSAIEDVENAMKGMLAPEYEEKQIGTAEVRQTFKASGVGVIAGSYVTDGIVQRNANYRIYRGDDMIFEGQLASLKRFKDDVKEVKAGYECGFVFDDFNDLQEGDRIVAHIMVEIPR